MKFGKIKDLSAVDFRLPELPERSKVFMERLPPRTTPFQLFLGCTGWSMKEWVGTVYPKGTKNAEYAWRYSQQFNTIEFNTTHYRIPKEALIEKWYTQTRPDFKFCPKIPQSISHAKNLNFDANILALFCERISLLKEKLGCCFMQLPPYFDLVRLPLLERFFEKVAGKIPLAVELRHPSFFETKANQEQTFNLFEKYGIAAVITDVAGRRDVLHLHITSPIAMVRFVGNELIASDYSRIDEWMRYIAHLEKNGLEKLYFFPHEPDNILAPELTEYCYQKAREFFAFEGRGPKLLGPENQLSLF